MSNESRKRARFHPYAFVENGLGLHVHSATLDDGAPIRPLDDSQRELDISGTWTTAKLAIECHAERTLLERVLPPEELRTKPRAEFVLCCRCSKTYFIQTKSLPLATDSHSPSRCEIELSARDLDKVLEISLELVRTDRASDNNTGFATQRGMRLASAAPWVLALEPAEDRRGRYLDVRYTSFDDDEQIPGELSHCLFHLHTDPTHPILFLNTDHALTHQALNSRGSRGVNARARDLALGHVGMHVWPELLMLALRELAELDDALPWQKGALERWLPDLFPDLNTSSERLENALHELRDDPYKLRQRFADLFRAQEGFGRRLEKLLAEPNMS